MGRPRVAIDRALESSYGAQRGTILAAFGSAGDCKQTIGQIKSPCSCRKDGMMDSHHYIVWHKARLLLIYDNIKILLRTHDSYQLARKLVTIHTNR